MIWRGYFCQFSASNQTFFLQKMLEDLSILWLCSGLLHSESLSDEDFEKAWRLFRHFLESLDDGTHKSVEQITLQQWFFKVSETGKILYCGTRVLLLNRSIIKRPNSLWRFVLVWTNYKSSTWAAHKESLLVRQSKNVLCRVHDWLHFWNWKRGWDKAILWMHLVGLELKSMYYLVHGLALRL